MALPEVDTPEEVSAEFQVPDVGPFGCRCYFQCFNSSVWKRRRAVLTRVRGNISEAVLKGAAVTTSAPYTISSPQDILKTSVGG